MEYPAPTQQNKKNWNKTIQMLTGPQDPLSAHTWGVRIRPGAAPISPWAENLTAWINQTQVLNHDTVDHAGPKIAETV